MSQGVLEKHNENIFVLHMQIVSIMPILTLFIMHVNKTTKNIRCRKTQLFHYCV